MSAFFSALRLLLSLLPAPFQAFVLGVLGLALIVIGIKIVARILDAIPFL